MSTPPTFDLAAAGLLHRAFGDVARVRILNLILPNEEMCIMDLELVLDFTQTKTSRHLGHLKTAGLVTPRQVDQWVYYRLRPEAQPVVAALLAWVRQDATLLADAETFRVLYSNRELAIWQLHQRQRRRQP